MDVRDKLLTENPWKLMISLSLPAILGQFIVGLYSFVDSIYVGQMVGTDAMSAVSAASPFLLFNNAIAVLLGIGSGSESGDRTYEYQIYCFHFCFIKKIILFFGISDFFIPESDTQKSNSWVQVLMSVPPIVIVAPAARDENIPMDVNASDGTAMLPENTSASAANATANATEELEVLSAQVRKALGDGRLDEARAVMETMLRHPGASGDVREELLYTLADIVMREGREDLPGNFQIILQAYEAAKNADVHSRNMPEALASLGYLHLAVGNVPEKG